MDRDDNQSTPGELSVRKDELCELLEFVKMKIE